MVARSKRTHEKYPARTSHFLKTNGTYTIQSPYLHYTDNSRLQACRCLRPQDHERAHPMSDDDKNLATAITRYMGKFDCELCHRLDFYQHHEQQRIEWNIRGVRAERFHYSNKRKDIVCRCARFEHRGCRRVQSPDIKELCAAYFEINTARTTCTREQWRTADATAQEPRKASPISSLTLTKLSRQISTPMRDLFEYDSPSAVDLLDNLEERRRSSQRRCSRPSSGSRIRYSTEYSCMPENMAHLSSGRNGETDIPKDVWQVSRPSVYLGKHTTNSIMSTPLGSSVTPLQLDVVPKIQGHRPPALDLAPEGPNVNSFNDAGHSDFLHSPDLLWLGSPIKYLDTLHMSHSAQYNEVSSRPDSDIAGLEVSYSETLQSSTSGSLAVPAVYSVDRTTHVAELPSPGVAVELNATPKHPSFLPHHSPTLPELGGGSFEHVAELAGRNSPVRSMRPKSKPDSRRITALTE